MMQRQRRAALLALTLLPIMILGPLAIDQGPGDAPPTEPAGPLRVRVEERSLDGIATRLFRPIGDGPAEGQPIILYLASWGGERGENDVLLRDIASWGFLVAACDDIERDPPYPDPDDESVRAAPWRLASADDLDRFDELSRRRTRLVAEKASRLLDSLLAGRADMQLGRKVGVLGYSLGGAAAGTLLSIDDRVNAAVNLDGWVRGTEASAGLTRPYLGLFAVMSRLQLPESLWPQRYWAIRFLDEELPLLRRLEVSSGSTMRFVTGVEHRDFSDARYGAPRWLLWRPWRTGVLGSEDIRTMLTGLLVPFLQRHLDTAEPHFAPAALPKHALLRLSDAYEPLAP